MMVFMAQVNPETGRLIQGLGVSHPDAAGAHMAAHPECIFVVVDEPVSPRTHEWADGEVKRKGA